MIEQFKCAELLFLLAKQPLQQPMWREKYCVFVCLFKAQLYYFAFRQFITDEKKDKRFF